VSFRRRTGRVRRVSLGVFWSAILLGVTVFFAPAPYPGAVAQAAATDVGPVAPRDFPPGYGPDPMRVFSPYVLPEDARAEVVLGPDGLPTGTAPPKEPVYLVLNVAARRLYAYVDGRLARTYPVAVGRPEHHTPIGSYSILSKAVYPTWVPPDGRPPIPPGPDNPLGSRWLGWSRSGFGLHGTNAADSIGQAVSLGCVRLHNADIEELFELVKVGTPLKIVYEPVEVAVLARAAPDGPIPPHGVTLGLTLALHPDVYRRLPDYRLFLRDRLKAAGAEVDPELTDWLVQALAKCGAVELDAHTTVAVGSRPMAGPVLRLGGDSGAASLVPVRAFSEALAVTIGWDESLGCPTLDGRAVQATVVAGRSYATPAELGGALGMRLDWVEESDGCVCLVPGLVYVNGNLVSKQAFRSPGGTYVPLRPVAEALYLGVWWDEGALCPVVAGRPVAALVIDGRSYVEAAALAELLGDSQCVLVTPDGVFITR